MTVAGTLLWLTAVVLLLFLLLREERKKVAEYEGLLLLLRHIRLSVASYALPKEQIFATFHHPALEACGFLQVLRRDGLSHALQKGGLAVGEEALRPFSVYAESLGARLTADELAACDTALSLAEPLWQAMQSALPTRLRLTRTLTLTGGMLVLLLFV